MTRATRRTASPPRRTISARWSSRASSTTCEHGGAAGRSRTRRHRPAPLTETMLFRVARTVLQAVQRQYFVADPTTDLPLPGMLQVRDHWEGIEDQTTQRERNARLPAIAGQVLAAPVSGLAGAVGNVATELGGVRTELAALPERVVMGLAGHFAATTPTSGTADSPAAKPSSMQHEIALQSLGKLSRMYRHTSVVVYNETRKVPHRRFRRHEFLSSVGYERQHIDALH
ncbi:hypothetical protein DFJ74DRAFT_162329 [Hyaloraphidium curvatum]|nr:hypothetical protein DFJ74DRAFT_162329 [Hyaloraphidium curvatum]